MKNESATIVPQYNKETPATICKRCGFVVEDPNQDFEISPDDNSRMHRLIKCFDLVNACLTEHWVPVNQRTDKPPVEQDAAFQQGFRAGSVPPGEGPANPRPDGSLHREAPGPISRSERIADEKEADEEGIRQTGGKAKKK